MAEGINLIAFGTFGNPNGFKQTFFIGDQALSSMVKTFDLNTNAIKVFPSTDLFSIRKENVNGYNTIAYSFYSFAKEQNSERSGTFIGSSILYVNKISDESITVKLLNSFQKELVINNVENSVIKVNHSNNLTVKKPHDFDKARNSLRTIENLSFAQNSGKTLVVYCDTTPESLQILFKNSLDLLNRYDNIFFTKSHEVAEYVNQKNIFKFVQTDGFTGEIQDLQQERRAKIQSFINDMEQERQYLDVDRERTLKDLRDQIDNYKKIHQDNQKKITESESDVEKVKQIYAAFATNIKDLVGQLQAGKKPDEVKRTYEENKRLFIDGVAARKTPVFLNTIAKPTATTSIRSVAPQPLHTSVRGTENHSRRERERGRSYEEDKEYLSNPFKTYTIVLLALVLLLGTGMIYFAFFKTTDKVEDAETIPTEVSTTETDLPQTPNADANTSALNPAPNEELNEHDYRHTAKSIQLNMRVDDIVNTIFAKNPTDISSSYGNQRDMYAKEIVQRNQSCFEEKDGTFYFIKDTLRHVPSYKK